MDEPSMLERQGRRRAPGLAVALPDAPTRLIGWAWVALLTLSLFYFLGGMWWSWWQHGPAWVNLDQRPIGRDFLTFWAASVLSLAGKAAAVYDLGTIQAVQSQTIGLNVAPVPWFYPPTYLLLVLPLSLLPYLVSLALWQALPLAALVALLRSRLPRLGWLGIVFPAAAQSVISGQNGTISACLFGGGLMVLERRPWVAGLCFGLLTYKPQLAILIGPALLAGRHWRALGWMAATAAAMAVASLAAFGTAPWEAFFDTLPVLREYVATARLPIARFATVFSGLRLLGLDWVSSMTVQVFVGAVALVVVVALWRRRAPTAVAGAALALAVPLATPYAYDYDLTMLAVPLAWFIQWAGQQGGLRRGEQFVLMALWAMPVAAWLIAWGSGVQLGPLVLAVAMVMLWRRGAEPVPYLAKGRRSP